MRDWLQELVDGVEVYSVKGSHDLYTTPPVDFIIEGLVPLYSVVGLTGFPGTGKTWLAFEMARSIITGTKFLGQFPAKKAPVLFIGNDASLADYAQQWRRLTYDEYMGIEADIDAKVRDSNPFDTQTHFLIDSEFTFDDTTQVARLIKTSQQALGEAVYTEVDSAEGVSIEETTREHFGLIVFDCLSKFTSATEGDNTATAQAFKTIRMIAEATGATILLLHHNASPSEYRTGEEWRGGGTSGAGVAGLDAHFHLTTRTKGVVEFKTKKMRGITPEPFIFALDVHKEGPASLDWIGKQESRVESENLLIEDLVAVLKKRNNAPTRVADFAIDLLAKYSTDFDDIKKFKKFISSTLWTYTRSPDARILAAITSGAGKATLYKLSPIEVTLKENGSDNGSSDGSGDEGVSGSGTEAPGLAD